MEPREDEDGGTGLPPRRLRLIQFGDLHLWRMGLGGDFFPKRMLGLCNLAMKRCHRFPAAIAERIVAQLATEQADFYLFSGDLSTTGMEAEFAAGRALLEPLLAKWGERFIAIPGNHDRYTPRAVRRQLFEKVFLEREQQYPFSQDLGMGWTLVGIDCSLPRWFSSRGEMTSGQINELREELEHQRGRNRQLMVMGHYPLLYIAEQRPTWEHVLPERGVLLELLDEVGAKLYLHGHKHFRWAIKSGEATHLNCGSAGMIGSRPERQPGYLRITLDEQAMVSAEAVWLNLDPLHTTDQAWHTAELVVQPAV